MAQETTSTTFANLGALYTSSNLAIYGETSLRRFRQRFGVTPSVCETGWNFIETKIPTGGKQYHILWALLILKNYGTEVYNRSIVNADEKTFRKWTWIVLKEISSIPKINWRCRLSGVHGDAMRFFGCLVSVDATDCPIREQYPFNRKWFSHKLSGPGLRYEIGISIDGGSIVWVNGPYPCGSHPAISIFREDLKFRLQPGERGLADSGYMHDKCLIPSQMEALYRERHQNIRARHENVNGMLKRFNVLSTRFRHDISLHGYCFHSLSVLIQYTIEEDRQLRVMWP